MTRDVENACVRLDGLEEVTHHHNLAHKAARERMNELEKELRALRFQNQSAERGRSPTPGRGGTGVDDRGRSPRGSRSPRDPDAELQVVFGGWRDARRSDAEGKYGKS